jgi:hypothetical protein
LMLVVGTESLHSGSHWVGALAPFFGEGSVLYGGDGRD